jgi:Lon protease-like protein
MQEVLPLFPLGTVLFPGLLLPLNIFEPRYRALVADLLTQPEERQRFGVVAIRQGREVGVDGVSALYDVGCAAQVRRVEEQEDGRYLLVTVGAARFRLEQLDAETKPYLQGVVTWLDEDPGDGADTQVPAVQRAFTTYLSALGAARETEIEVPELPGDARLLSYLVAAATVADHGEKQALLAALTTADRLQAELVLLRREQMLLTTLTAAPAPELTRSPQSPN